MRWIVLVSLLMGAGVSAQAEVKVAVPPLGAAGVEPALAATLTKILMAEVAARPGLTVIGASDIAVMLDFERQKLLLGCADNVACMAEIGGALGVEYLLAASVGVLGSTWVLNAKLIDSARSAVVAREYQTVSGPPDQLIAAVRRAVEQVLAPLSLAAASAAAVAAPGSASDASGGALATPTALAPAQQGGGDGARAAPPAALDRSDGGLGWLRWGLVGAGGLALLAAGGLSALAWRADQRGGEALLADDQIIYYQGTYEDQARAHVLGRAGLITGATGAALLAAGLLWLLINDDEPATDPSHALWLAPAAAPAGVLPALVVGGRW